MHSLEKNYYETFSNRKRIYSRTTYGQVEPEMVVTYVDGPKIPILVNEEIHNVDVVQNSSDED